MTRKTSVNEIFKQSLAVFRWELRRSITPLVVYAVIAVFFIASLSSLALSPDTYDAREAAAVIFQSSSSVLVFILSTVFTIIFTLRSFGYLHNKRKADMFAPLPVKSYTLFFSKTASAFLLSVIPALFFLGIIILVSALMGHPDPGGIASLLVKIPLGAAACISFYGLIAICCGTSVNTVLTFLAICFAYPIAAKLVKNTIESFYYGITWGLYNDSFLLKALNPLAAYDGINVIYWLLFIAACIALSAVLIPRRKAERAQSHYAFRLPCYAVELLMTFILGMVLGLTMGGANLFGSAYPGFVFGFLLGGTAAFVICHLILFRGFGKMIKSLIYAGGLTALTFILMGVCCLTCNSFTSFVPEPGDVQSAGLISYNWDFTDEYGLKPSPSLIRDSAGDFTDKKDIDNIIKAHKSMAQLTRDGKLSKRFNGVLSRSLVSAISALINYDQSFSVAYKLNDGRIVTRYYENSYILSGTFTGGDSAYTDPYSYIESIKETPTYAKKYSFVASLNPEDIDRITLFAETETYITAAYELEGENAQRVLAAFRDDYFRVGEVSGVREISLILQGDDKRSENTRGDTAIYSIISNISNINSFNYNRHEYTINSSYTETIKVLKELGILNSNGKANPDSKYVYNYNSYIYDYDDEAYH